MPSSRVFVSYVCIGDEQGARIGKQLVSDIRATNTEAVADHETISDERFMPFLSQELPQCGYLLVVQTPLAVQSWRVQKTLTLARTLAAQQRMRAIVCVIAAAAPHAYNQPLWEKLLTVDASMDYPRAREKVFLALNLVHVDTDDSFIVQRPLVPPGSSVFNGVSLPPQPSGPVSRPGGSNWQPSGPISRPAGSEWLPQPSGPMSRPGGSEWQPQLSGPAPRPGGSEWQPQPPGPAPRPAGSEWLPQPPVPLPVPGGSNWSAQPSGPMMRSGGSWPVQPPGPMASPTAQVGLPAARLPGSTISPQNEQFLLRLKRAWSGSRPRPLRTSQTSIAAVAEASTLLEDRPQSLHTTRSMIIRWAVITGILLVIVLGVALLVFLLRDHLPPLPHWL